MRRTMQRFSGLWLAVLALPAPAIAAPEEIQVYMDELNAPGEVGLDLHLNHVPTGGDGIDYAGEQSSLRRFRLTPELSLGLGHGFELGVYVPLATLDRTGRLGADGAKVRLKWLGSRPGAKIFWGGNFEIGYEDRRLSPNPWSAEFKTILGAHLGRWTIANNVNFDFVVSGPAPSPLAFDTDTRISYALTPKLAIGIESYDGFGSTRDFGDFRLSEQSTFFVIDADLGRGWGVNVGIGHGYGGNADGLILKAIISVPIGGHHG